MSRVGLLPARRHANLDAMEKTDTPVNELHEAQEIAQSLWDQGLLFLQGMMRPWNAYQVVIILGLFILSYLLAKTLAPRLHDWLRTREGWPKWRMRFAIVIHRRIKLICFVALIWPVIWAMREFTWPSRSYLVAAAGQMAFAWLVIAIVTRLIANGFIRTVVRYTGWTWATLSIMGLTEDARRLLDSAAVELGDTRFRCGSSCNPSW